MSQRIRSFGAIRMVIGAFAWLAPSAAARWFGLRPEGNRVMSQLFGARDLALGALTAADREPHSRTALQVGIVIDTLDAIGCLRQRDQLSLRGKFLTAGGAALFASLGTVLLAGTRSSG